MTKCEICDKENDCVHMPCYDCATAGTVCLCSYFVDVFRDIIHPFQYEAIIGELLEKVVKYEDEIKEALLTNETTHRQKSQLEKESYAMKLENQRLRERELCRKKTHQKKREMNTVACSWCGFVDNEDRVNICIDCSLKDHNIIVKKGEKIKTRRDFDTYELAICSNCILDNHVGEEHKIVKFYPVLAATEAAGFTSTFMMFRQKMAKMKSDLNNSKKELFTELDSIDEKFQSMFNLVKRSKSTEATKELIEVAENRYRKIKKKNETINASLELYVKESYHKIQCINEENKELEEELCQEKFETHDWEVNISQTNNRLDSV